MKKLISMMMFLALLVCCASAPAETLRLPEDLTTIGERAFYNVKKLDEVVLPQGVTTIGKLAFAESSIQSITIPAMSCDIADDAFDGVENLVVYSPEGSSAQKYVQAEAQSSRGFTWGNLANKQETVTFGTYPQGADGEERPIEWIVLTKDSKKALLLSKYCLDLKQYYNDKNGTGSSGWSSSDIRSWLNSSSTSGFLGKAFTAQQMDFIQDTQVDYGLEEANPNYVSILKIFNIAEHRYVTNKVFLLSYQESQKYFPSADPSPYAPNAARAAKATEYVRKLAENIPYSGVEENGACSWWLRSLGAGTDSASIVQSNGAGFYSYQNGWKPVRPALWVSLSSGIL